MTDAGLHRACSQQRSPSSYLQWAYSGCSCLWSPSLHFNTGLARCRCTERVWRSGHQPFGSLDHREGKRHERVRDGVDLGVSLCDLDPRKSLGHELPVSARPPGRHGRAMKLICEDTQGQYASSEEGGSEPTISGRHVWSLPDGVIYCPCTRASLRKVSQPLAYAYAALNAFITFHVRVS